MSTAAPTRREHYPELDGLRGLSIILVLLGHARPVVERFPLAGELAGLGVLVFFGLSGFLITDLLVRERAVTGGVSLKNFYMRRVLRIFPAYYLLILVVTVLWQLDLVDDLDSRSLAACVLYLRNIFGRTEILGHTWSLALEEQFYALWPTLFVVVAPQHIRRVALGLACAVALARGAGAALLPELQATGVFYMRPWFRLDSLLVGCVLALTPMQAVRAGRAPGLWLGAALVWTLVPHVGVPVLGSIHLTVQTVLVAGALWALRGVGSGPTLAVCRHPVMRWVGRVSYSLYLWQQVFVVKKTPDWGVVRAPGVDLLMTVAAALVSYYVVEKWFLSLKRRFE